LLLWQVHRKIEGIATASPPTWETIDDIEGPASSSCLSNFSFLAHDSAGALSMDMARELQSSEKDQAENLMIVDLLRNDLGRVCKTGSIKANQLFTLHSFSNVHHLISSIEARLAPNRDGLDLLEACARLAPMYSFVLTFAGNGDAYGEAREYAAAGGMADRVRFLGWTEGEALEDLYRESDVFVLPSWTEGLPNAMIEAMASGLAVVVSAVGTIPDVVTDGHDALVVPPKDVDALAGALRRVMDDPGLLDTLARNGHRLATEEFAVEPAVERLARVIDDVVAERRSGRRV